MSASYLRNTNGCIAVYDITDRESFQNVENHIREFLDYHNPDLARAKPKKETYKTPAKKKRSGVLLSDSALKKRSGVSGIRSHSQDSAEGSDIDETPPQINNGLQVDMPYNVVLVGTKLDLVSKTPKNRAVPYAVAYELAQKLNLSAFYEISSKTSKKCDIDDSFMTCVI